MDNKFILFLIHFQCNSMHDSWALRCINKELVPTWMSVHLYWEVNWGCLFTKSSTIQALKSGKITIKTMDAVSHSHFARKNYFIFKKEFTCSIILLTKKAVFNICDIASWNYNCNFDYFREETVSMITFHLRIIHDHCKKDCSTDARDADKFILGTVRCKHHWYAPIAWLRIYHDGPLA